MRPEQIGVWIIFTAENWRKPNDVRLASDIIDALYARDDATWRALLQYLHEKVSAT